MTVTPRNALGLILMLMTIVFVDSMGLTETQGVKVILALLAAFIAGLHSRQETK